MGSPMTQVDLMTWEKQRVFNDYTMDDLGIYSGGIAIPPQVPYLGGVTDVVDSAILTMMEKPQV